MSNTSNAAIPTALTAPQSLMYPNREGTKFDMAYYVNRHIPRCGNCCNRR